jgi:beta-glucosidase
MSHTPFPPDFLWGAATAAFQIEGAADTHAKGPSIWDAFCAVPGHIRDGATGAVTCDHYHRMPQDVRLMQALNLRAYRFSISWPRVMPTGRRPLNPAGLDFYDRLVDTLREAGIEPLPTLYHWDLPLELQTQLGGWAHDDCLARFADYAALMFDRLGDRVHYWLTLNEPQVVVDAGYFHGMHPPGVTDRTLGYRVGHNLLRAHALAVERYRAARSGQGQISLAINAAYAFPHSDAPEDQDAAERAMLNFGGWFADPVHVGDYPAVLRQRLGAQLPEFSPEDTQRLKGSTDFFALNYYFSDLVRHAPNAGPMETEIVPQTDVPHTEMGWPVRPDGLHRLLVWLHQRYGARPVYITENGIALNDVPDAADAVDDPQRIAYLRDHIAALAAARADGVDVRGYFVWSLIDNLEWAQGFSKRFGLVRCNYETQERIIKASGHWYAKWIAGNGAE